MLRTVTPTLSATIGVNCPGHIGIGLSMVPKDPNWIGIQIAPRVSMVASTLCWVAPEARSPTSVAGGSAIISGPHDAGIPESLHDHGA